MMIAAPLAAQPSSSNAPRIWESAAAAASADARTASIVSSFLGTHDVRRDTIAFEGGDITVTFLVRDADSPAADRLIQATRLAITRLVDWLGPLPASTLVVADVPWHAGVAGASFPGVVVTSTRWLSTRRDFAVERPLLAALARQYTFSIAPTESSWFEEGLALYLGTRLIHEHLEGRNFNTLRYFGGFVPFSLRSVLHSPSPTDPRPRMRHLADVEQPVDAPWRAAPVTPGSQAQRAATAMHTLERYVGWPAFQQMLAVFMDRYRGQPATPSDFAVVATDVRGRDLSWYFDQALRFDSYFDYAVTAFHSNAVPQHGFRTSVTVRRLGSAIFAGTGEPAPKALGGAAALPLLIQFDDGSGITDWVDGREAEQAFEYLGPARAVLASVDPEAILLLDEDRTNNTRTISSRPSALGVRLAISWMMWLQDTMLAYTGVL
jgi:hypothetical protein